MISETYLSARQVADRYQVSRVTPWRWTERGDFPRPTRLSPGCTRWRLSDLEKWEQERASDSEAAA